MLIVAVGSALLAVLHGPELWAWLQYRHSLLRMRFELGEILSEAEQEWL